MRLSGAVYLELIKQQKYFLGSLSLAWCNLGPILLLGAYLPLGSRGTALCYLNLSSGGSSVMIMFMWC